MSRFLPDAPIRSPRRAESAAVDRDSAAAASDSREGVIAGPARDRFLGVGVLMLAAVAGVVYVQSVRLPYDETFGSVLYLMWSANSGASWIPEQMAGFLFLMAVTVPLFLIAWGIVWPRTPSTATKRIVRWCYRFALCWPILSLLSTTLGRAVGNAEYALAPWAAGDVTPLLARLEGPVLSKLQGVAEHPWIGAACSGLYSSVWIIGVIGFGPWLVIRDRARAVGHVVLGTVLTAVLAVPFFLLFPVFDPWATNPLYGYTGPGLTSVRYLYPHADLASLSSIAMNARWATGSCLPSLHVAFPLVFALIAARHRLRIEAWLFAAIAAATSVAVVYLGRHWIVDVMSAVPFAFGIRWVVERIDARLDLSWERSPKGAA